MSKEYDETMSRLLHTTTSIITDFIKAEKDYYKAKKLFHDKTKPLKEKLLLLREEGLELIRIRGEEDDRKIKQW